MRRRAAPALAGACVALALLLLAGCGGSVAKRIADKQEVQRDNGVSVYYLVFSDGSRQSVPASTYSEAADGDYFNQGSGSVFTPEEEGQADNGGGGGAPGDEGDAGAAGGDD